MKKMLAGALSAMLLAACSTQEGESTRAPGSGIVTANFDATVQPQSDFYRHVNGTWLKSTEIPADKSNYGSFTQLADETELRIRAIIDEVAAQQNPAGSEAQKVGDLYASFMAETRINELGLTPLQDELARIDAVQSKDELTALMARLSLLGVEIPFGGYVTTDNKQSDQYILYLYQSGLGLPDRDYYLEDTEKFQKLRQDYTAHVAKVLDMAGMEDSAAAAGQILALETRLAQDQWTRVDSRDRDKTYNKRSVAQLAEEAPGFGWARYFNDLGGDKIRNVIVMQPSYFSAMATAIDEVPLEQWRTYLKWNLINTFAAYLSEPYVKADFDFYGTTLRGVPEIRSRWKRGVSLVEDSLGMALGKIYVEKHFPPEAKARMQDLVGYLIEAYRQSIQDLEWMSAETKQRALQKLGKFTPKIGYPDKWRDYSGLEIKPDDLVGNVMRATRFEADRQLDKLGKPVDRDEWHMTPQTVNAYYNPGMNEIVFPAAILQPPFFNLAAEDAVNYGGIGAVIGHEIGHGFDDQGSKYDGDGNLNNWWTDADRKEFEARAKLLIEQYNGYCPLEGECVNGALTIGENIGDLGGLSIAYKAYHLSLDGAEAPVLDGFTGDQRLLIGWAQVWARKYREEELLNRLKTDPHSPSQYRANGTVANVPAFYEAFEVQPGDAMYIAPEKRVRIW